MTRYQLLDLINNTNLFQLELLGYLFVFSTSAIVGAYVAGKKLDWILAFGICGLYSFGVGGLFVARLRVNERIAENIAEYNTQVTKEAAVGLVPPDPYLLTGAPAATPLFYFLVWAAVIFFVFYARRKFGE